MFPLYPHGLFGTYAGLLIGTLAGVAFGFVLERAGFGRARNLAAQFYLTDLRVLKVMFSAIVTACVGMAFLAGIGVLDLALITVPETFLWPQLVGGLLLGAGFIVSGYCPGTGVVAVASGNLDAVAAIGGIMAGSLAFGFGYGPLESFYKSGAMGVVRIDRLLGVPMGVVAAAVVAMAVGAFLGGEKLEAIFAPRQGEVVPASPARVKARVFGGFAVVAALALVALALPGRGAATPARVAQRIDPLDLARDLVTAPDTLWIVDLRPDAAAAKDRIPGAMAAPAADAQAAFAANLAPTRRLIVYGATGAAVLPDGVRKFPGDVFVLEGGFAGWTTAVLTAPIPPANPTPDLVARFQLASALHARFTGAAAAVPVEIRPVSNVPAAPRKGGGC
ncbi:MAG: YeeE/YedE thiosulfate transporter family protein [Acidobacteriota bacterium]